MALKPQDILVALKLVAVGNAPWSYTTLAVSLGMSPSEVHSAVKRLAQSRLVETGKDQPRLLRAPLSEFLCHGLKYVFPAEHGELTRGIPTAWATAPLDKLFVAGAEPPPVWPHPQGSARGMTFQPLYKAAPSAAMRDPALHELLALVDALRDGRVREREAARRLLAERLGVSSA